MGELRFDNESDLQKWFRTRSPLDVLKVASQSALRTIPELIYCIDENFKKNRQNIILPVFRANIIAKSARWNDNRFDIIDRSALNSIYSATKTSPTLTHTITHSIILSAFSALRSTITPTNSDLDAVRSITSSCQVFSRGARYNLWEIIIQDIEAIEDRTFIKQPLWYDDDLPYLIKNWQTLRDALLSAKNEDWAVWTDWYEARLRGDPVDIDLERAKALIPDEIWKQGPKIANAEIRRLIDEHAAKKLEEVVSPLPLVTNGTLTIGPNTAFDASKVDTALLALSERQCTTIDLLLETCAPDHNDFAVSLSALRLYRNHLDKKALSPAVDLLSDMHASVRAEYLGLNREAYFTPVPGMRQSFLNFFALHKKIVAEFPKTAERARRIESAAATVRMPDRMRLTASFTVLQDVLADVDERYINPDYTRYANTLMKDTATALDTPPPSGEPLMGDPKARLPESEADTWLTMRFILKSGAFFGKTYRLLLEPGANIASLLGFLETERGKRLMAALREVRDAVWSTNSDE